MKCNVCGVEIQSDEQQCSKCNELKHKVQILSPEEKQDFSGLTIEQDPEKQSAGYNDYRGNQRIYVKHVNFSMGQTGMLTKILFGIIIAGLLIVALPIALFIVSIVMFTLYFMRK
ncbi:hypothetical protein [Pelosinus propionicus]|uniref:Zinc-ribbon domain-containing protein n=1 Tax=Pelosinus propionicus DSM 13327 TaxID=1123291 RepID=A0A1I4GUP6_9FIRM|nr:hypothetical protein [Pelosinus propionicus]SFL33173.1 hypothetical protein SAMN04490355_1001195 [Pelosinus propionicus DSM 13327]